MLNNWIIYKIIVFTAVVSNFFQQTINSRENDDLNKGIKTEPVQNVALGIKIRNLEPLDQINIQ